MKALRKFRKTDKKGDREEYVKANQEFKRVCREEEGKFYTGKAEKLNECRNGPDLWREIRELGRRGERRGMAIEVERLVERYEDEMWAENLTIRQEHTLGVEQLDNDLEDGEIEEAIKEMKDNKAAGADGIPAEFYKNAPKEIIDELKCIFKVIWKTEKMPQSFRDALIYPIFKKGDPKKAENYRGIAFMNVTAKIFTRILYKRIAKFVEENNVLTESQFGFRKAYSTKDAVYTLHGLAKLRKAENKKLYVCFVDLSAAFDTIDRGKLVNKLGK